MPPDAASMQERWRQDESIALCMSLQIKIHLCPFSGMSRAPSCIHIASIRIHLVTLSTSVLFILWAAYRPGSCRCLPQQHPLMPSRETPRCWTLAPLRLFHSQSGPRYLHQSLRRHAHIDAACLLHASPVSWQAGMHACFHIVSPCRW